MTRFTNVFTTTRLSSSWPGDSTDRPDWDLIIGDIERRLPRGGRVLDFGCYSGGLLALLDSVYERYGVEVNRAAAAVAAESAHAQIWSRADDIPRDMRFDVVVAADVIEHMANPLDTMSTLMTLLTHDGILIVTTGDADNFLWNRFGANWWYCFYPEHVAFVSRAWVELALCRQGWEILHCERFRYRRLGPLRRLLEFAFACAYGLRPKPVYLYIGNRLRRSCGRRPISSVAGNGAAPTICSSLQDRIDHHECRLARIVDSPHGKPVRARCHALSARSDRKRSTGRTMLSRISA